MSRPEGSGSQPETFGVPGAGHLLEGDLHNLIDARLSDDAAARCQLHADDCVACRDELLALRNIVSLGALLQARATPAPDLWPVVRAATVDAKVIRRRVLRHLRVPLLVWTVLAFAAGVVATEVLRDWSRRVATASAATAAITASEAAKRDALMARQLTQLRKLQDSVSTRDTSAR